MAVRKSGDPPLKADAHYGKLGRIRWEPHEESLKRLVEGIPYKYERPLPRKLYEKENLRNNTEIMRHMADELLEYHEEYGDTRFYNACVRRFRKQMKRLRLK